MKNKKRTFFVVLAIILTAGVYYFYSKRNEKSEGGGATPSPSGNGKLYSYEWIGCNSCPPENVTLQMVESQKSGFAGIHIGQGFDSSSVSIGDTIQIVTNQGSDVEGTYELIGKGAGCMQGASGYKDLLIIDLVWNCGSHPSPSLSNGGVIRIIKK